MKTLHDLKQAYDGSFYTITGAGGDLQQWIDGYEKELEGAGIGKPVEWYTTTGASVNAYANPQREEDAFQDDLTFLLFPLDELHTGKLAMFKLQWADRWFDDIVDNMR